MNSTTLAGRWRKAIVRPWPLPLAVAASALMAALAGGPGVWDALLHRKADRVEAYLMISKRPTMRGPNRILFSHVVLMAEHAKTVDFVRNFKGRYAVVRRKPGVAARDVEVEISNLIGGPVEARPLPGLWFLKLTAGESFWGALLILYSAMALTSMWRRPVEARYWLYGGVALVAWDAAGLVLWAALGSAAAGVDGDWSAGAGAYMLALSFYLAASAGAALFFWQDLRRRCRTCLERLRMPLDDGATGGMVVDPETEATVCIHGHGTRIAGRWQDLWQPAGDYWDELVRTSVNSSGRSPGTGVFR